MERSWSENSTLKRASVLREHGNQYIHHLPQDPEWEHPISQRRRAGPYTCLVPRGTNPATWATSSLAKREFGGV